MIDVNTYPSKVANYFEGKEIELTIWFILLLDKKWRWNLIYNSPSYKCFQVLLIPILNNLVYSGNKMDMMSETTHYMSKSVMVGLDLIHEIYFYFSLSFEENCMLLTNRKAGISSFKRKFESAPVHQNLGAEFLICTPTSRFWRWWVQRVGIIFLLLKIVMSWFENIVVFLTFLLQNSDLVHRINI